MEELKPCPFCGGKAVLQSAPPQDNYFVSCRKCGATTMKYFPRKEDAAAMWNRRAAPENKPDLTEIDRVIRLYEDAAKCPCDTYSQLILAALHEYKSQHMENKALTLDELKKMDGEPVWIELKNRNSKTGKFVGWAIMDSNYDYLPFMGDELRPKFEWYGRSWLAYARKPEK